jgi:hypothetical protein
MRMVVIALLLIGCATEEAPRPRTIRHMADVRHGDGRMLFTDLRGDAISPATVGRLVMIDLATGDERVIDDDPTDSNPFVVPGTDDVLFVSSRSGLASLYLARPGHPPRRITNAGVRAISDPRWVPVPGRELWFEGRVAVFTAHYGGVASRWRVDVDTGAAEQLW